MSGWLIGGVGIAAFIAFVVWMRQRAIREETPADSFYRAAVRGDLALVRTLLERDPDLVSSGQPGWRTPLIAAADRGRVEVVDFLLAHGAEVDAKMDDGSTALIAAAISGHKDVVALLIAAGADLNTKCRGLTAIHFALSGHHNDVVELLRRSGVVDNSRDPLFWAARSVGVDFDEVQRFVDQAAANYKKKKGL